MPEFIGQDQDVQTSDQYTEACTLGPVGGVAQINFHVIGNPALATFWKPLVGSPGKFTEEGVERVYVANTYGAIARGVSGVKFRSRVPGQPAIIIAEMVFMTDPQIEGGTVAGGTIAPDQPYNPCPCGGGGTALKVDGTATGGPTIDPCLELRINNDDSVFPSGFELLDLGGGVAELVNLAPEYDTPNSNPGAGGGHFWEIGVSNSPDLPTISSQHTIEYDYMLLACGGDPGGMGIQINPDGQHAETAGILFTAAVAGQVYEFRDHNGASLLTLTA